MRADTLLFISPYPVFLTAPTTGPGSPYCLGPLEEINHGLTYTDLFLRPEAASRITAKQIQDAATAANEQQLQQDLDAAMRVNALTDIPLLLVSHSTSHGLVMVTEMWKQMPRVLGICVRGESVLWQVRLYEGPGREQLTRHHTMRVKPPEGPVLYVLKHLHAHHPSL